MNNFITKGYAVRESTPEQLKQMIDQKTFENVKDYFDRSDQVISQRITELEKEWDIERVLEVNMSTLAITGFMLSIKNKYWLTLPVVVTGFLAQYSLQGWCPPVTLFRKLKFRMRKEIEQEKHALKALRGDYSNITSAEEAYLAVNK
ncbi:MAG: hypothetical protein WEA58_01650 [Balneolaceae bacterium]